MVVSVEIGVLLFDGIQVLDARVTCRIQDRLQGNYLPKPVVRYIRKIEIQDPEIGAG